ncbi:neutral/alkaline non-lysosomal ceramidase N-terminal domain-containing protein [Geochorda subterranea]|uniref:Neutral/alkaline non-lysosomal ceramidase N-terminal domain-containing protein n=1 Tax=Geochorda subterranea TaxID=3109564 RepID=A0ABZ1BRC2_9FIRM|nr:neutral/alkaline non-lysosomal ceramidase N-terminal domain-containing protein [Limnochorda sp. LNt]WRP15123.1 neutral/alkaline non-lysosomal ceramidase N-terminal domain-containing protein [Limnochorda sp. LNt]
MSEYARPAYRVGVARLAITPPPGTLLVGYAARTGAAADVHDDLFAHAIVVDDGTRTAAIVCADLLSVHPDVVGPARGIVAQRTGLDPSCVMIAATHTHSGPPAAVTPVMDERERAYVAWLPFQVAGAVELAMRRRSPARLAVARGIVRAGVNRRQVLPDGRVVIGEDPAGPVDPYLTLIRIEREDGAPAALVVHYGCHPVCLGPDNLSVSADYPGSLRATVESVIGVPCIFWQGTGGDVNPRGRSNPGWHLVDSVARALATEIGRLWHGPGWAELSGPVGAARRTLVLPVVTAPEPTEASLRELKPFVASGSLAALREMLDRRLPWSAQLAPPVRPGEPVGALMEVQCVRIGGLAVVGLAAEPFAEIGLAIREAVEDRSGPHPGRCVVVGYANGCVGYLPSRRAHQMGGYEVDEAYLVYRLPGPLAAGVGEEVVSEAVQLARKLLANGVRSPQG